MTSCKYFFCSTLSSAVSYTVIAPFDTIKVILQSSTVQRPIRGILENMRLRDLFRGHMITMLSIIPSKAIYLALYDTSRKYTKNELGLALWTTSITTILMNPIFYIRTMRRISNMRIINIISNCSIRDLYRGGLISITGGTFKNAIFFTIYNRLMNNKSISWSVPISALSSMIASSITYPYETIRTRIRIDKLSFNNLYSGFGVHIIRTIPKTALLFTMYEISKKKIIKK